MVGPRLVPILVTGIGLGWVGNITSSDPNPGTVQVLCRIGRGTKIKVFLGLEWGLVGVGPVIVINVLIIGSVGAIGMGGILHI